MEVSIDIVFNLIFFIFHELLDSDMLLSLKVPIQNCSFPIFVVISIAELFLLETFNDYELLI